MLRSFLPGGDAPEKILREADQYPGLNVPVFINFQDTLFYTSHIPNQGSMKDHLGLVLG